MTDMNKDDKIPRKPPLKLDMDAAAKPGRLDTFDELERAGKKGTIFQRFNAAFQEKLQTSRGSERTHESVPELLEDSKLSADDLAIRRAKNVGPQRMVVPEGVIISGSMSSGAETEISGRVEGDVLVEGRLFLGPTALISGNVRAVSCKVDGLVEGRMECSQEIELGRTGRLNADAIAGKKISAAGQIKGNVITGGVLRLAATGRIEGDIQVRQLVMEEGATFNGKCTMSLPGQRSESAQKTEK